MRRIAVSVGVALGLVALAATASSVRAGGTSPAVRAYVPVQLSVPAELPGATQGKTYSYSFAGEAKGGTGPPYHWVLKGALPGGLRLNASTGRISGTVAKTAGVHSYSFTVCATGAKRPLGGSAPGNTACDTTRLAVAKGSAKEDTANRPACTFTLAAAPPGVNVTIDAARATSVIGITWSDASCKGKVTFSTVGSPPTGVSISFLNPPTGTQGTTLSLAAAQDAKEGNYELTILGTSGSQRAQTTVVVTVAEPDFSGTYNGTWNGTFVSARGDNCSFNENGNFTAVVAKQVPSGYSVTMTFTGRTSRWNTDPCEITATTTDQFTENGSYEIGSVKGPTFTITGGSISGQRSDTYPGGTETAFFRAQK